MAFKINNREIAPGKPVYVIAELSANHNGEFEHAVQLIHAAKEAGADAIKVQTYTPDTMTLDSRKPWFKIDHGTIWDGRYLYDLYREAQTPWDWQPKLQKISHDLGLDFFSTPFDFSAVDFLEKMAVPVYKIASFEVVDLPLIGKIAETGKPIIMSTGMASLGEIEQAVQTIRRTGNSQIALLKCTSAYPAPPDEMNLKTIPELAKIFDVVSGLSDHTLDATVPIAATALGACIIEKHLTLSREVPGPDSAFSLEPQEFKAMVEAVRTCEKALGTVNFECTEREKSSRHFRRSLFVVEDMRAGEVFSEKNVRGIRPAHGLKPRFYEDVLGKKAARELEKGTPLSWEFIV